VRDLAGELPQVAATAELAAFLVNNRGRVPAEARLDALRLALALSAATPGANPETETTIANWLFELGDSSVVLAELEAAFEELPPGTRSRLEAIAAELLAHSRPELDPDQTDALLVLFDGEERQRIHRQAVRQAIAADRPEIADRLFALLLLPGRERGV